MKSKRKTQKPIPNSNQIESGFKQNKEKKGHDEWNKKKTYFNWIFMFNVYTLDVQSCIVMLYVTARCWIEFISLLYVSFFLITKLFQFQLGRSYSHNSHKFTTTAVLSFPTEREILVSENREQTTCHVWCLTTKILIKKKIHRMTFCCSLIAALPRRCVCKRVKIIRNWIKVYKFVVLLLTVWGVTRTTSRSETVNICIRRGMYYTTKEVDGI